MRLAAYFQYLVVPIESFAAMELGGFELNIFVSLAIILATAFVALIVDYLKGNNEQLREHNLELRVRREEWANKPAADVPLQPGGWKSKSALGMRAAASAGQEAQFRETSRRGAEAFNKANREAPAAARLGDVLASHNTARVEAAGQASASLAPLNRTAQSEAAGSNGRDARISDRREDVVYQQLSRAGVHSAANGDISNGDGSYGHGSTNGGSGMPHLPRPQDVVPPVPAAGSCNGHSLAGRHDGRPVNDLLEQIIAMTPVNGVSSAADDDPWAEQGYSAGTGVQFPEFGQPLPTVQALAPVHDQIQSEIPGTGPEESEPNHQTPNYEWRHPAGDVLSGSFEEQLEEPGTPVEQPGGERVVYVTPVDPPEPEEVVSRRLTQPGDIGTPDEALPYRDEYEGAPAAADFGEHDTRPPADYSLPCEEQASEAPAWLEPAVDAVAPPQEAYVPERPSFDPPDHNGFRFDDSFSHAGLTSRNLQVEPPPAAFSPRPLDLTFPPIFVYPLPAEPAAQGGAGTDESPAHIRVRLPQPRNTQLAPLVSSAPPAPVYANGSHGNGNGNGNANGRSLESAIPMMKAQPDLLIPTGLQERQVLERLLESSAAFTGVVMTIGIDDFKPVQEKASRASAPVPDTLSPFIRSLAGEKGLASRFADDEIILVFPRESGLDAQRRINQISERLWDFQLRSLGSFSILFSWGAAEPVNESLADGVATAYERLNQTRRNRKTLAANTTSIRRVVNA